MLTWAKPSSGDTKLSALTLPKRQSLVQRVELDTYGKVVRATPQANNALYRALQPSDGEALSLSMSETGTTGVTSADVATYLDINDILSGFYSDYDGVSESKLSRRIYSDIMARDICGSVVEVLAHGASGDIVFAPGTGMSDTQFEQFSRKRSAVNEADMGRRMLVDCMAYGDAASVFLVDVKEEESFPVGVYMYDPTSLDVEPLPISTMMPLIRGRVSPSELLAVNRTKTNNTGDKTGDLLREYVEACLGSSAAQLMTDGYANPEYLMTLRNLPEGRNASRSMLSRVLTEWFYKKNIFRGTLENSIRRINGIMHVVVAMPQGTESQPRLEDMQYYGQRFQEAALDPTGAMVITRDGVSVNEVAPGGQFWTYDSVADSSLSRRLKLMGVPESLATLDFAKAPEAGIDAALGLFRKWRDKLDTQVMQRYMVQMSIFAGNFKKDALKKCDLSPEDATYVKLLATRVPLSELLYLPNHTYKNSLDVSPDPALFDWWDKLKEQGIPLPLATLASLGNVDLAKILKQKDADLGMRKDFADYMKSVKALMPKEDDGGGGGGGFGMSSVYRPDAALAVARAGGVDVEKSYSPAVKNRMYRAMQNAL